jgi:hypothetical protein
MLTTILVVLAVIVVLLIAAWVFLDLDVTDVAAPVIAPVADACVIYFYGTLIAWVVGLALMSIGGLAYYLAMGRRRRRSETSR